MKKLLALLLIIGTLMPLYACGNSGRQNTESSNSATPDSFTAEQITPTTEIPQESVINPTFAPTITPTTTSSTKSTIAPTVAPTVAPTAKPSTSSAKAPPTSPSHKPTTVSTVASTTATKSSHTHSFVSATCTSPMTCSCGATKGAATGHIWKDATCTTAKTCSICNATKGNPTEHQYKNGKCSACGKEDIANPQTQFKKYARYVAYDANDTIGLAKERFISVKEFTWSNSNEHNGFYYGDNSFRESYTYPGCEILNYQGKDYYWTGGVAPNVEYRLTDTYVEFYIEGLCSVKYRLQHDNTLIKLSEEGSMNFPDRLYLEKECPNNHMYNNVTHKCTVCGKEDIVNPKKHFSPENYIAIELEPEQLIEINTDRPTTVELQWTGKRYEYWQSWYSKNKPGVPRESIMHRGETYYNVGGGGTWFSINLTDTHIEFYDSGNNLSAKYILQHDGSLRLDLSVANLAYFPKHFIRKSLSEFSTEVE